MSMPLCLVPFSGDCRVHPAVRLSASSPPFLFRPCPQCGFVLHCFLESPAVTACSSACTLHLRWSQYISLTLSASVQIYKHIDIYRNVTMNIPTARFAAAAFPTTSEGNIKPPRLRLHKRLRNAAHQQASRGRGTSIQM